MKRYWPIGRWFETQQTVRDNLADAEEQLDRAITQRDADKLKNALTTYGAALARIDRHSGYLRPLEQDVWKSINTFMRSAKESYQDKLLPTLTFKANQPDVEFAALNKLIDRFNERFGDPLEELDDALKEMRNQRFLDHELTFGKFKIVDTAGLPMQRNVGLGAKTLFQALRQVETLFKRKRLDYLLDGILYLQHHPQRRYGAAYHRRNDRLEINTDATMSVKRLVRNIVHELGHRVWFRHLNSSQRDRFASQWIEKGEDPDEPETRLPSVTPYGTHDRHEDFAETFTEVVLGTQKDRRLAERLQAVLPRGRVLSSLEPRGHLMNRSIKRRIIAQLLRAGRPRLANAVASIVIAKMSVQEALNWLDFDAQKLGDASALKKAYRDASLKHHPDRGGTKEAMQSVNEAFEVLRKHKGRIVTPSDRAAEKLKYEQAATIVMNSMKRAFDAQAFTDHISKAAGKPFDADVKFEQSKGLGASVKLKADWKSRDGLTMFELRAWSYLNDFLWGPRQLGAGGQDYRFKLSAYTRIFHETRKAKFKQRDWAVSSDTSVVFDPEAMFPRSKIKAMIAGKEKKRKFSKRDMLLGLEKLVGAKVWRSGRDDIADIPLGKDGMFMLQMRRITMMGRALWVVSRTLWEGRIGRKGAVEHNINAKDVIEKEAALKMLADMKKQAANIDDAKKLGKLIEQATNSIYKAWQAGKLD